MRYRLALLVVACLAAPGAAAQGADAAMQNLLAGLTRGTEITLYTPLASGLIEITRFTPPLALPRPEAEAAVAIARQHLRLLDIAVPTADQLARALVGGSIEMRDGPQSLPGVLPLTGERPVVITQIVTAGTPLPVAGATAGAAAAAAASGGTVPPTQGGPP